MNRKQQGDLGVAMAIAYYTHRGYVVAVPLTDNARYDLVVDNGLRLLRVQVKTTGHRKPSGAYEVHLRTCGGNQSWNGTSRYISEDECDALFVYTLAGSMYDFPAGFLHGRATIDLGPAAQEYRVPDDWQKVL